MTDRAVGGGMRDRLRYARGAMALHWLTAAAFAFQIGLGFRMNAARGPQTFAVFQLHKSVGITILLLTLLRIGWRLLNPPPPLPATLRPIERRLAHLVHLGFYVLLLGLPLSGWLIVSSSKVAIPTFLYGTVPWPHIPGVPGMAPAAKQGLNDAAATAHVAMVWIALAAILLHVAGALKHQFVDRGDELGRMVPVAHRSLNIAAVAIVALFVALMATGRTIHLSPIALAQPAGAPAPEAAAPPAPAPTPSPVTTAAPPPQPAPSPPEAPAPAAAAPVAETAKPSGWKVRMGTSSIRFHSAWSQGPIDGGFGTWRAAIDFDPDKLAEAKVSVTIDMASVTAADGEQKSALPENDWFAVATHPTATWRATRIRHTGGDRYQADGELTLRDGTHPLPLSFTLKIAGDVATMSGTTRIDRTTFGVGQGEWASTADVPALVTVTIAIKADRAPAP